MFKRKTTFIAFLFCISLFSSLNGQTEMNYDLLMQQFKNPDHAQWGEVPLWWWEADTLSRERITRQLEKLAAKGVKAVCPIQRSPARTYPESFSEEWWEMIAFTHSECQRLGMALWLYDQVGYGQYGWLEKAAAQVENTGTYQVKFYTQTTKSGDQIVRLDLEKGLVLDARAFPVKKGIADDEESIDIKKSIQNQVLTWAVPSGKNWTIAVSVAVPYRSFYLNEASTEVFLDQLYRKIEQVVGKEAMGKSLAGVFQDEHPPTPRDLYTQELAESFRSRFGYDIGRAIPALHFDVGPMTPKYRIDFFDAYLDIVEKTYWKKIFDWTNERNVLTSHDNWGRMNIYAQSFGYIDYFRTQRWFSAPGLDDWGQFVYSGIPEEGNKGSAFDGWGRYDLGKRNYYDAKIASSIARLYNRPRVWLEGFHSSGWGRTTDQTLSWLSTVYAFGANLYDEHGFYYSLNASTWEHAAPDPHFRQPYWDYYNEISKWVSRSSFLLSQGHSVVDVAVHYPVTSLLADLEKNDIDYNEYMDLSRWVYQAGIDNDIIDDQSIEEGVILENKIVIGKNEYKALVFGPEITIRLSVLRKVLELVENGGVAIFYGNLPTASVENGREDPEINRLWKKILGVSSGNSIDEKTEKYHTGKNGYALYLPNTPSFIPAVLTSNIDRDFTGGNGNVIMTHRRVGETEVYFLQNTGDRLATLDGRFLADGVPEIWDPFTGKIKELESFERKNGYTYFQMPLEGNVGQFVILNPHQDRKKGSTPASNRWTFKEINKDWSFSLIPTRDNRAGDFEWPPSDEKLGMEVRALKYKETDGSESMDPDWYLPGFDDLNWETVLPGQGSYWLSLEELPADANITDDILRDQKNLKQGDQKTINGSVYQWQKVVFSPETGLGAPAPWGGHSGYPDGHYDKNFIRLKSGRKLLFTRIISPKEQPAGLNVQLRNQMSRLWVNGKEERFSGSVGNLPLKKGYNYVLLDIPDGGEGMIYVQKEPPVLMESGDDATLPSFIDAQWIWSGESEGAYFRKTFDIDHVPESAHMIITGVSGFQLFINGIKAEEDIGPWATWEYPKSVNIRPYLKEGRNLIAVWGQFLKGMNVSYPEAFKGIIGAVNMVELGGNILRIKTDGTWKGQVKELKGWQLNDFDDSSWSSAEIRGNAGTGPWGDRFIKNTGSSTTPKRPLSVHLTSPLLEVFDEMPGLVYDVQPESYTSWGYYRFEVPPGLKEITIPRIDAEIWVEGKKRVIKDGRVLIEHPPIGTSEVAIRLKTEPGQSGGGVFKHPVEVKIEGGKIREGEWSSYAMPTYSGKGSYQQTIHFSKEETQKEIILDLGEVYVSAEVIVNGEPAGIRVAYPFKFDISDFIREGENKIEIRVANTLAPHYSFPRRTINLGPVKSGLVGPVRILMK